MVNYHKWFYCSRRKWKKKCLGFFILLFVICLFFYIHIVYNIHKQFASANGLSQASSLQLDMDQKIKDVRKNIVDIEYIAEYSEDPSQESFLNVLGDKISNNNVDPISTNQLSSTQYKKKDMTIFESKFKFDKNGNNFGKYLYLLGHYEQLGKTVVNFLHAGLLAKQLQRHIIIPFVRNSRFCGLRSGWIGAKRRKSREFLPIDNYFELSSMEKLFHRNRLSSLMQFEDFQKQCPTSTIIYFLYFGGRKETKRYFQATDEEFHRLESRLLSSSGVIDCMHVEEKIKSTERIQNVTFDKAYCIDAERVKKIQHLSEILEPSKCVTIFLWRGAGPQRTHFNLTLPLNHEHYLSQIDFSDAIMDEAASFLLHNLQNKPFIGIQIRSERQLSWYGLHKFKHCLDLVVKVATIFMYKKNLKNIFVSSDLEKHGSDQLRTLMNDSVLQEAKSYFQKSFQELSVHFYKADKSRGLIHNDAGYVALTQMEILSRSKHLITLGAGTFQSWVKTNFKKHKQRNSNDQAWSITRVCSVELKKSKSKKKGGRDNRGKST